MECVHWWSVVECLVECCGVPGGVLWSVHTGGVLWIHVPPQALACARACLGLCNNGFLKISRYSEPAAASSI